MKSAIVFSLVLLAILSALYFVTQSSKESVTQDQPSTQSSSPDDSFGKGLKIN